jgi:hypothetical protein
METHKGHRRWFVLGGLLYVAVSVVFGSLWYAALSLWLTTGGGLHAP